MGEFASNAKANTAVSLGATGLGIAVANAIGTGGLGNFLGNMFGNNNRADAVTLTLAQKDAEIAMLKSENYSDKVGKEVTINAERLNNKLRDEMYSNVNPIIENVHNNAIQVARLEEQLKCCCEKQAMQNQIFDQKIDAQGNLLTGKINETALALNGKIDTNEAYNKGRFSTLDQTIACISGKLNEFTSTTVSICKINPPPVPAALGVPPTGTTWYPCCMNPLAGATTSGSSAA